MALIEIDGLPFLKMVDLSMAMLNNQMVLYIMDYHGDLMEIFHGDVIWEYYGSGCWKQKWTTYLEDHPGDRNW